MLTLNFSPFPILKTDRLILRRLMHSDEKEIFFLRSDERVNTYVDRPKPGSLTDARNHIDKLNTATNSNESIAWGIILLDNPAIIGTICLWNISKENDTAEVGFDLMPGFQGKGIMREALSEVIRYAFEILKTGKVIGWVHPENSRSISLLEKSGFTRDLDEEEKAAQQEPIDTSPFNMAIYSFSAKNYLRIT
jgi:ribosomal-protein-alanine N-acetyltransferase